MSRILIISIDPNDPTKCKVENITRIIAGSPYVPPPGRQILPIGNEVFVGIGFIGTLVEGTGWTFAAPPPPPEEEPPPEPSTVPAELAAVKEIMAELAVKVADLERVALG